MCGVSKANTVANACGLETGGDTVALLMSCEKLGRFSKKTINNLCKELQINEDIEKMIFKFLN